MASLPTALKAEVDAVISKYPDVKKVIDLLISHYETQEPERKKQRAASTPSGAAATGGGASTAATPAVVADQGALPDNLSGSQIVLQIPELSVQSPFRKKLNMVIGAYPGEKPFLAFTKAVETQPEFVLNDMTASNVDFATFLNVPDRKEFRYLLISYKKNMGNLYKNGPILVMLNNDQLTEQFGAVLQDLTLVEFLMKQFEALGLPVVDGTSDEVFFAQGYNGTKEGYLYFLNEHVIFGFKKPILIFSTRDIESVTYTSITRLTFNVLLNVFKAPLENGERPVETFEFTMIDQKEFDAIDQYVKNKKFQDNSMAAEQKAQKQLKSNNEKQGALKDAAKQVPGGREIVGEDLEDDEEEDANYEYGDDEEDESDEDDSGDDDDDDDDDDGDDDGDGDSGGDDDDDSGDDEDFEDGGDDDLSRDDLVQELQDLGDGLDDGDYLQMGGYADTPR